MFSMDPRVQPCKKWISIDTTWQTFKTYTYIHNYKEIIIIIDNREVNSSKILKFSSPSPPARLLRQCLLHPRSRLKRWRRRPFRPFRRHGLAACSAATQRCSSAGNLTEIIFLGISWDIHRDIMGVRIDIRIFMKVCCAKVSKTTFEYLFDDNYQMLQYYMSHHQNSMSFRVQCLVHFHALSRHKKQSLKWSTRKLTVPHVVFGCSDYNI